MRKIDGLKLLITIVDRDKEKNVEDILNKNGCMFQISSYGIGTASKEILDLLNLGEPLKAVIFSFVESSLVLNCLNDLENILEINKHGNGISLVIDINSIPSTSLNKIINLEE